MRSVNEITIHADPARIYALAAKIEDWPRILPHYRYVRIEERTDDHKLATMGASRDGFPVRWRARQDLLPAQRRIQFKHIGGVTRGMDVEWRIEPGPDSGHVSIHHGLSYPLPILGPFFAEYIVGRLFVHNIAGKTLKCIKQIAESEMASAGSSSPASAP